jgi:GNAT superfamily N-acetyltransferase
MNQIQPDVLQIRPLTPEDADAARGFSCGDDDLDDFLQTDAIRLQAARVAATFLAFHEGRLVAYVALLADAVRLKTNERKKLALHHDDPPMVPALKIARLGVSTAFRERGAGRTLVAYGYFLAIELSKRAGCRLLTVDAYPAAIAFYARLGFVRNQDKAYDGKEHPSMRLDVFAYDAPGWISELGAPAKTTAGERP